MLEASPNSEFQNKKRRDSPFDRESRAALMYLISKMLAQMRKASVAKISLLIFMTEPSIWRLRNGVGKFYITNHFVDIGKMILNDNDNRLVLIACNMKSTTIGARINMQRNPTLFRTMFRDNKRLALR